MKKKKLTGYVLAISVLMLSVLFMGASCSASTANISNPVMTTGIDDNYQPVDDLTEFPVNSIVYVVADMKNAPEDTQITFVWYIENEVIDSVTISNEDVSDAPVFSYLPAELTTVPGNYSVEIYIDDREDPDTVTEFVIQ
ncbi:hypothetical protein [Acetobacterium bakii]|uniref:Uncharacterized protein n=1 Tax=Acetobacterium bakii TaxID=52689 RepID=A0A0L6TZY3_9FIRM|nr:hypothetical protein [Acetobacterium bakii]KNZ41803.1 hypothetical protein AKG39_09230 [Acetobacterium bakii]